MTLHLHNTLTKSKDLFTPMDINNVRLYVCGPTVYDAPHIGNGRAIVVYDVLYRLLCFIYGSTHVTYVRNITDVDDKINDAAKKNNISINELTDQITKIFHQNIECLNCLPPNFEPKATEHISEMIHIIELLIKLGHAYVADNNHVYFNVMSDPNYGKLAGRKLEDLHAGSRIAIEAAKHHAEDFVLWKPASKDDDKSAIFDSPWGPGRPGWHIECSAMSSKYLGNDFDIHGGGADLMFPHHTNEIAQSCSAFPGSKFARFWVHNGFVTVAGEKMSKSLGNFITLEELLDQNHKGEVLRYMLLSTHYRKPFDFNQKALEDSLKSVNALYRAYEKVGENHNQQSPNKLVVEALCDDLNTPLAFKYLHDLVKEINKTDDLSELAGEFIASAKLLGFFSQTPKEWFKVEENALVEELVQKRSKAKAEKNWEEADKIRRQLLSQGVVIEDSKEGSVWRKM